LSHFFSFSLLSLLLFSVLQEMCAQMYYRGKMFGFVHLYSGQEAVSTGVIR
jgi:pyruvate dehydrogenase E1 component alpha subunit